MPGACFNPRPALGPGATADIVDAAIVKFVSILARLWGRALLGAGVALLSDKKVSILARLWGRALRKGLEKFALSALFQSSPGFGAGRYLMQTA